MRKLLCGLLLVLAACEHSSSPSPPPVVEAPDEPSPHLRNVDNRTAYVGDAACASCHAPEAKAYAPHAMARSFHAWTPAVRVESTLTKPLNNKPTGFDYTVVQEGGMLYQVEQLVTPDGKKLHELRRRMDWVMGSGHVARSYFTEENGRLFQLPLTWYSSHGWDFSPGYEINDARFDRWLPDRCVACHSSYPTPYPQLEGKYAQLNPGIGCERCHGPGALHVAERRASTPNANDTTHRFDDAIVNPARLPLERRLDVCEQCHVHTAVNVPRYGRDAFSYLPSQPLRDQWALFKTAGSIDIVSHADRLRQSACFIASRTTQKPLECATCHDPHQAPPDVSTRSKPCLACHDPNALATKLATSSARADHVPNADCVRCHMPTVAERSVPHGTFTDHWIRVASRTAAPVVPRTGNGPIEPFFARDRSGPDADIYRGMGGVVYANLANDRRALGDAAATLHRAIVNDTTRADAHFMLGVAYQQLGVNDEAIRALELAVRIDSSRAEALRALAQAYERAGRARPASAVEQLYRRALSLQPRLAWMRAEYADFLQSEGRTDDAVRGYREAIAEEPSLSVAWFNLGTVLTGAGRTKESTDAFRQAVHLDPSLGQAVSTLLLVRTANDVVGHVVALPPPAITLPVRDPGPYAVRLTVDAAGTGVRFTNVPPGGTVQIMKPDGTILRTLAPTGSTSVTWDLLTDTGAPVGGGLLRARVLARDPSGRAMPSQTFGFGVVRQHVK